ncbi:hypothetical protein ZWY2020_018729 [Hordeum vulgare]|nr:hypothetical protein ZWY2020_018729 [Hordeum vulgare]
MVSRLIGLIITSDSSMYQQQLLRSVNRQNETVLHEAVRIGDVGIVEMLMKVDPELANYPEEGISPLYLAISLQKNSIAHTLCNASDGTLSYSGLNGQNALHVAILGNTGTHFRILNIHMYPFHVLVGADNL